MTRQEKEAAILAYCEEVTKGYNDPRPAGLATVDRMGPGITPNHMIRWKDALGENVSAYITRDNICKYSDEAIDLLYLLLGLETRALEEEIKRLRDGITEIAESKWTAIYPTQPLMDLLSPPTP